MQRRWIRLSLAVLLAGGLFLMFNVQAFASEPYVKQTKKDCRECHVDRYYPGKDFFKAETQTKWHYHWWAFSLFLFVFCAGVLGKVYVWSMGRGKVLPREGIEQKRMVNFLFFEAILQRRLFKESRLRWFIYLSESFGFMALFFVFLVFAFTRFVLQIDFFITGAGGLILEFLMDFLGLLILSGTIASFIRRSIKRPNMITEREDIIAVLLLFLIVLTGFLLEGFRLAVLPVSFESYFSFAGLAMASLFRLIPLAWTDIHFYTWIVHATIVFIFLAYIPFSKFIHFIACPVSILASSSDPQG
ncbi:MAG: respiratory nitrate reductase subunit gamma [Thermodesulfobacteriota bacterium]|jgi:nitrate reductase gamma subunit